VSREPSRVEVLRKLEAMAAQLASDVDVVSADIEARQHRCPPREMPPGWRRLPVLPGVAATPFAGDDGCPDPGCVRLRGLLKLRGEVAALINEVKGQILRRELKAHRGRRPGSRTRELVRAAEAALGADAPNKAVLRYIDARLPKGQKAPDESTVRKYRGKSGGN
jgi:hypothetical protein